MDAALSHAPTDPPPRMHDTSDAPLTDSTAPRLLRHVGFLAALAAVAALVIGTIGPPLFGDGVFLGADQGYLGYPWRAYDEPGDLNIGHHGPVTDTIDATYPTRVAAAEALRNGDFFGWNPYVTGGAPAAAVSSNGTLSPFGLIYTVVPDHYAPALIKLVVMAVAVGFTFLFGRRIGLGRIPALFAGAAFAGSGFLVMWTNWPHPEVACLIAPLFWATERYLQGPSVARAAPIALVIAAMLLGYFPAVTAFAMYALVGYVVLRLVSDADNPVRRRLTIAGGAGAGLATGVLLVAVVLLPFLVRLGDLDIASREQQNDSHVPLAGLVTTIVPKALGLSTDGGWYGVLSPDQIAARPDVPPVGPQNQIEVVAFVGVTTVLLALAALCLRLPKQTPRASRTALVVITGVLGLATYVGGPLLTLLQQLPVFSNNFIGRSTSVMGFTVACLAGIGLQAMSERRWPVTQRQRILAGAVGVVTIGVLALVMRRAHQLAGWADRTDTFADALRLPVLVAACAAIALLTLVRSRNRLVAQGAMAGMVGLLVVESLALALPLLPNEDERLVFPPTAGIGFLVDNIGHDRVAPEGLTLFGSATTLFHLRSATGHSFAAETWKDALQQADPDAFRMSPTLPQLRSDESVVTAPVLDRLGVRWYAAGASHVPLGDIEHGQVDASSCERPVPLTGPVEVTIPAGNGLRGAIIRVCSTQDLPYAATLVATAEADGRTGTGRLQLPTTIAAGNISLGIPADDLGGAGDITVRLDMAGAEGRALALAADTDGTVAIDPIRPVDDGLRLAYADDLRVYERTRALPRIRWSPRARVVEDDEQRLRLLADGNLPDDTVLLTEPGPTGSGESGSVEVVIDAPTAIELAVTAEGDGHVVVADALLSDWVATVNGERADLVAADHAGVAVAVPEGDHTVELRYQPRGQRAGLAISGLSALGLLAAVVVTWRLRTGRARTRG